MRKHFILWPLVTVVSFMLFYWIMVSDYRQSNSEPPIFGTSFSTTYAQSLNLNWHDAFEYVVQDLEIKNLRLNSYWSQYEPQKGEYDFTDLKWQLDTAAQADAKVLLVLGAKQPRRPDCHLPQWASELPEKEFNQALISYVEQVIKEFDSHPSVSAYQLENESRNLAFSSCYPNFDADRIAQEMQAARALTDKPILTNLSDEIQFPTNKEILGDKVGYSVYERVNPPIAGKQIAWQHVIPSSWFSFRSSIIELMHGKPSYIHELQAEPWGPEPTYHLSLSEQKRTMNPEILAQNIKFAKNTGAPEIYLWGAEWWYYLQTTHNDPSMAEAVKTIL